MNPYQFIPYCSLVISVVTAIFLMFGHKHTIQKDLVSQLETRVAALERELAEAKEHIKDLEEHNGRLMKENIELLRKIARMGNGT